MVLKDAVEKQCVIFPKNLDLLQPAVLPAVLTLAAPGCWSWPVGRCAAHLIGVRQRDLCMRAFCP